LQYIKAEEGCMKVGHCTAILTPSVLVHAKKQQDGIYADDYGGRV